MRDIKEELEQLDKDIKRYIGEVDQSANVVWVWINSIEDIEFVFYTKTSFLDPNNRFVMCELEFEGQLVDVHQEYQEDYEGDLYWHVYEICSEMWLKNRQQIIDYVDMANSYDNQYLKPPEFYPERSK